MKTCTKCGIAKPLSDFNRCTKNTDGHRAQCKDCQRAYQRVYNHANKPRTREYQRKWMLNHYHEHHDEELQRLRRYRNSEQGKLTRRILQNKRRGKQLAAEGTYTKQDVLKQYKRQKGRCYWCDTPVGKTYHVDHVIPLDKGGGNGPDNIVIACPDCNLRKHNKLPHEFSNKLL